MIHENVPGQEAEKMVAEGGRILEHKLDAEGKHVCKVEVPEKAAAPEEAPAAEEAVTEEEAPEDL